MIENRDQPYIKAGEDFVSHCESGKNELDPDQILLNDTGRLVAAINTVLSQINHIEQSLKKEDYVGAGIRMGPLVPMINVVIDSAERSKIVSVTPNQSHLSAVLSGLKDFFSNLARFFTSLSKKEEQVYKESFQKIKEKYQAPEASESNDAIRDDSRPAVP